MNYSLKKNYFIPFRDKKTDYLRIKNFLLIIVIFYFLALLQSSFLPFFNFSNLFLNLIFILIILINLFEAKNKKSGFFVALIGGFFLDIFSQGFWKINFFGFNILILIIIVIFIKFVLKKYFFSIT